MKRLLELSEQTGRGVDLTKPPAYDHRESDEWPAVGFRSDVGKPLEYHSSRIQSYDTDNMDSASRECRSWSAWSKPRAWPIGASAYTYESLDNEKMCTALNR